MLTPLQRQILGAIAVSDGLSRTDLVQFSGMSKAAVSGVVREMIDAGFLFEVETVPGAGQGRPSVRLLVHPEGAYFAGVSLLQDPAHMVLINLHGEILSRTTFPLSNQPQQLAEDIAAALPVLLEHHAGAGEKLLGLGVTLSGFIDAHQSTCVQSALLGWRDVPLAALVSETTGMNVAIENDAKALAVSEKRFGHARELSSFTLVSSFWSRSRAQQFYPGEPRRRYRQCAFYCRSVIPRGARRGGRDCAQHYRTQRYAVSLR